MYIVIMGLSCSNEDSHEFPRIHTVWSYKNVKSTMPSLFDSLGTLILVKIGHESSKYVYFSSFSG